VGVGRLNTKIKPQENASIEECGEEVPRLIDHDTDSGEKGLGSLLSGDIHDRRANKLNGVVEKENGYFSKIHARRQESPLWDY